MFKTLTKTLGVLTKKEKQGFRLLTVADIFIACLDILFLVGLLWLINFYTSTNIQVSWLPAWLNDPGSLWAIAIFTILFALKNLIAFMVLRGRQNFVYGVAARLSEQNLLQYLEGDYTDHVNTDSAVMIRRVNQQPVEFAHYVLSGWQQVITQSFLVVLAMVAIIAYNSSLFLMLLLVLIPPFIISLIYAKRRLRGVRTHSKAASEKALQFLKEALAGFAESNVYGKNRFFTNRYAGKQKELNHYLAELQVMQGMPSRIIELFAVLGFLLLLVLNKLTGVQVSLITIGAFVAAAYKIIPGIVRIINTATQISTYEFALDDQMNRSKSFLLKVRFKGEKINTIELKGVSFRYNGSPIINNLNLSMKKGDLVGISGDSGIGKTTVINLLLGFLENNQGNLYYNETAVTRDERRRYWNAMSLIMQKPFLIHDTLLKNIVLDENDYDREKLEQVVKLTGLEEVLKKTNEDLNKVVSEDGKNLSGGERQRVCMARALYKDADCILLDEPFSELDAASEKDLNELLLSIASKGKIVVVITHSQASLSYCNKILKLA